MIEFFKKLFCKHIYNTIKIVPSKNNKLFYIERKCFKCGKEDKSWFDVPNFHRYY